MKYEKPSLLIAPALEAVRSMTAKHDDQLDNPQLQPNTPSAYEADE